MSDAAASREPDFLRAFDGSDWSYYVRGHVEDDLHIVDDPEALEWEKLWMKEIPASHAEDYVLSDDDPDDLIQRDPATGRFRSRTCWIECAESAVGAEPWMGVKYAPAD